jgi:hypothetical protein
MRYLPFEALISNEENKIEMITQYPAFAKEKDKEGKNKMSILEKLSLEQGDGIARMNKALCFQLANDKQSFDEYYKKMLPSEVWEMYAIKLALNN